MLTMLKDKIFKILKSLFWILLIPSIALALDPYAKQIQTNTGNFTHVLNETDTTVQKALDKLDSATPTSGSQSAWNAKADYQFGANNFNGTGNFNTTGNVTVNTLNYQTLNPPIVSATWGNIVGNIANQTDLQNSLALKENVANKSTDVNLGTSDSLYPSQKAVKTYVDNKPETDPVYSAWDKSTGITITKSQVSDFGNPIYTELDPVWNSQKANYSLTTHNHALAGLTEKSYNSLTDKPSIPTQYTDTMARAAISETVTGLTYTSSTGVLSQTAGYVIPTTAEESNWNTAYEWGNHASGGYAKLDQTTPQTFVGTFTLPMINFGSTTGVSATATDGVLTLQGLKSGGFNENLTLDFETTTDRIIIGSNSSADFLFNNHVNLPDSVELNFGSSQDARFRWQTSGNDNFQLGLACNSGSYSGYLSILEKADIGNANRSPLTTSINPVLRIYSADETEANDYVEIFHDQNKAVIANGVGDFKIDSAGSIALDGNGGYSWQINGSTYAFLNLQTTTAQSVLSVADNVGNQLVLTNFANYNKDFDHNLSTNPTLFIHSDVDPDTDNTQWLSLSHDQTDGVINVGKGTLRIANLTSNGFVKTSGSNGALSVDTSSYQPLDADLTEWGNLYSASNNTISEAITDSVGITSPYFTLGNDSYSIYSLMGAKQNIGLAALAQTCDVLRGATINKVEYWDGADWQIWDTVATPLVDGDMTTSFTVDYDHRRFRVTFSGMGWRREFAFTALRGYTDTGYGVVGDFLLEGSTDNITYSTRKSIAGAWGGYQVVNFIGSENGSTYWRIGFDFTSTLPAGKIINFLEWIMFSSDPSTNSNPIQWSGATGARARGAFTVDQGILTANRNIRGNDGAGDYDCYIKGDTDASLFYTDASTDRVGIGKNNPATKLDVAGTVTATAYAGGNVANWDSAYGWGDHSTAGYMKLDQTTPQTTVGTFAFSNATINSTTATSPWTTINNSLTLFNDEIASSNVRYPPPVVFRGHQWTGSADRIVEHMLASDPMSNGNGTFRLLYRIGGTGSWTTLWSVDSNGKHEADEGWERYGLGEAYGNRIYLSNAGAATVDIDQFSPALKWNGNGWKTGGTPGSQTMSFALQLAPEQGTTNPIGTMRGFYGTNNSTPNIANELYRLEWGDRLGFIINEQSLNGFKFRVEGDTDTDLINVNTVADKVGIGTASPASKLDVAGDIASTISNIGNDSGRAGIGLYLNNPTASTAGSTAQFSPLIKLTGSRWVSGANETDSWIIQAEPTDKNYLGFYSKNGAAGYVKEVLLEAGAGMYLSADGLGEAIKHKLTLSNVNVATAGADQYSGALRFYSSGWKTDATAGSECMSFAYLNAPEQAAAHPVGVHKVIFGTNTSSPSEANEFYRLEWGARFGITINDKSLNGLEFRVEGDTDDHLIYANGVADKVGIGTASPSTKLDVNGTINATAYSGGNVSNWDAAYTHSNVITGNPHQVTKSDVGLGNVANVAQEPALGNPAGDGYVLSSTAAGVRSWTSQTGGMVYPGAGIPVSNGSSWGSSITNNSNNWNTAYGWGNHAGLYIPIAPTALDFTDVASDVELFKDTTVADDAAGKSLYIWRKAAEGNRYAKLYFDSTNNFFFDNSGVTTNSIRFGIPSDYIAFIPNDGEASQIFTFAYTRPLKFNSGDIKLGNGGLTGRNPWVRMVGFNTEANAEKYVQFQVSDATNNFELTREDTNIAAFDIQMPTIMDGVTAAVSTGDHVAFGTINPSSTYKYHFYNSSVNDFTRLQLLEATSAATNDIMSSVTLKHTSTGDMIDGFGPGFLFAIQDTTGIENFIARMSAARSGADNSGVLNFDVANAGTLTTQMYLTRLGNLYLKGILNVGDSTGVSLSGSNGILTMQGQKASGNNENLVLDFETNSNVIGLSSTSSATINNSLSITNNDSVYTKWGNSGDAYLRWETTGNDSLYMGISCGSANQSGYILIGEAGDITNVNRSPSGTTVDPTLRIYSADETQANDYIELSHNQSDGVITVGNGNLRFSNLSTDGFVKTSGANGTLSVDTTTYLDTNTASSTYLKLDQTIPQATMGNFNFYSLTIEDPDTGDGFNFDSSGIYPKSSTSLNFECLEQFDYVYTVVSGVFTSRTAEASTTRGTAFTAFADVNQYLYICMENEKFDKAYFDIATQCSTGRTLIVEYPTAQDTWATMAGVTDFTNSSGTFRNDGFVGWTIPENWVKTTENGDYEGYWVRLSINGNPSTDPSVYLCVPRSNAYRFNILSNPGDTVGIRADANGYWTLGNVNTISMFGSLSGATTIAASSSITTSQGLTTTSTDGLVLTESSAASSGTPVRISPRILQTARVWDTAGAGASKTTNFKQEVLPTSGNPGTARLLWGYDYNGGGYAELMALQSTGVLRLGKTTSSLIDSNSFMTLSDDDGTKSALDIVVGNNAYEGNASIRLASSGGTAASPTGTLNGDVLGEIHFLGRGASSFVEGATIRAIADDDFSTTTTSSVYIYTGGEDSDPTLEINGNGTIKAVSSIEASDFIDSHNILAYNAVGDGVSDNTIPFTNALNHLYEEGGGTLYIPAGVFRVDGQIVIPTDGGTPPKSVPIRITGVGAPTTGYWDGVASNASVIDLRYASDYKIVANGISRLELDHILLKDGGVDSAPFLFLLNTCLIAHDMAVSGTASGASAVNDFVVMGTTGWGSGQYFQGYGTQIKDCYFDKIQQVAVLQSAANGIIISGNIISSTCGDTTSGAITVRGYDGTNPSGGNIIRDNLIEAGNYKYFVHLLQYTNDIQIVNNNFWDLGETSESVVYNSASSVNTFISGGLYYGCPVVTGTTAYCTILDEGTYSLTLPTIKLNGFPNNTAASGQQSAISIMPYYQQNVETSTASNTDLLINRGGTVGTGLQRFIDLQESEVTHFNVDTDGDVYALGTLQSGGPAGGKIDGGDLGTEEAMSFLGTKYGLSFNGTNNSVAIGGTSIAGTTNISGIFDITPAEVGAAGGRCIFQSLSAGGGAGGLEFRIYQGHLELLSASTALIATSTGSVANNEFCTVGFSYNPTTGAYKFYKNGVSIGSGTNIVALTHGAPVLGSAAGVEYYSGIISRAQVYGEILTDDQFALDARAKWHGAVNTPLFIYRMTEGANAALDDISGNTRDGTIYSASWVSSNVSGSVSSWGRLGVYDYDSAAAKHTFDIYMDGNGNPTFKSDDSTKSIITKMPLDVGGIVNATSYKAGGTSPVADGTYTSVTTKGGIIVSGSDSGGGGSTRGTFTNASLTAGKLTITHNLGLSAPYSIIISIFDNNNKQIIPDEVTGSTNSVEIDLSSYGAITGTWGYAYVN